ncbi:MAG: hypothetical protein CFE44_01640 [Burkholderiales bacterium PBB4]|nr:MAG: hypothetical protein CFE44_01640 [Burkholderiales bacterium PBB4]
MVQKKWMLVVWPAFLAACAMEMLVFAMFDPHDLRWFGSNWGLSSQGTYTLAFLAFWAITTVSSVLTVILSLSSSEVNQTDV